MVPDELVQDLEDDRVVLFCGAGISMGAGLPDYGGLTQAAFDAMLVQAPPKRDPQWYWPDRMLGELEARSQPGAVREAIARVIASPPTDTTIHNALLRLAKLRRFPGLRLVTTNFDTYFEAADASLRPGIDLHSGPLLPIPKNDTTASWRSVVHLHGRLELPPGTNEHLVLTSADFGRAYLTEGWAARFVGRLFADFSVLFVGYSLNDPVLRYMTDAFAAEALAARRKSERPPAYIFVAHKGNSPPAAALEDWRRRGLEPIFYSDRLGHRQLRDTLAGWAAARDDWLSSTSATVARLGSARPESLGPSEIANLIWAVLGRPQDDGYGAKVFAQLVPVAPIEWLAAFEQHEREQLERYQTAAERSKLSGEIAPVPPQRPMRSLSVSFGDAGQSLEANAFHIAQWLAQNLNEDALADWVTALSRERRRPHPVLRRLIRRKLRGEDLVLAPHKRRFWHLVSSEAWWMDGGLERDLGFAIPRSEASSEPYGLGQAEFLALLRPYIHLAPTTWRMAWAEIMGEDDPEEARRLEERFSRLTDAEVKLVGEDQINLVIETLNNGDDADARLATMADDLTSLLKQALDLWALVDEASAEGDPSQYHQPSISPHEQNQNFHVWTTLIDLLWRAWRHIDAVNCDASRMLVQRWKSIRYPTFGRLVLAAISRGRCWTVDEKVQALLNG